MRMRHYGFLPIVNLRLAQRYCPRLVSLAGPSASPLALGFAYLDVSNTAGSGIGIFRMAVQILKLGGTLTNPLGSVQTKAEHATGSKRATLRNAENTQFHHSVQHTIILLSNIVHTKAANTSKCYPYSPTYLKRLRAFNICSSIRA